jgi:hypothetical protein
MVQGLASTRIPFGFARGGGSTISEGMDPLLLKYEARVCETRSRIYEQWR